MAILENNFFLKKTKRIYVLSDRKEAFLGFSILCLATGTINKALGVHPQKVLPEQRLFQYRTAG
jgi:hypothetical protein